MTAKINIPHVNHVNCVSTRCYHIPPTARLALFIYIVIMSSALYPGMHAVPEITTLDPERGRHHGEGCKLNHMIGHYDGDMD